MKPEHRRPLIAAVVVLLACAGMIAHAMRTDALGVVSRPMRVIAGEVIDPVERTPQHDRTAHDAPVVPPVTPSGPTASATTDPDPISTPGTTSERPSGRSTGSAHPNHAPAHEQAPPAGHQDHGLHVGQQGHGDDGVSSSHDQGDDDQGEDEGEDEGEDQGDDQGQRDHDDDAHGRPWWSHATSDDWRAATEQLLRAVQDLTQGAGITPPWEQAQPTR